MCKWTLLYVKDLYILKLDVNVCIYFRKDVHLTGMCKIPCESRIGFGNARFTGVSMASQLGVWPW